MFWLFSIFAVWFSVSFFIHKQLGKRHETMTSTRYSALDELIDEYFKDFHTFQREEFEFLKTEASRLFVSRGTTAIVQVISNQLFVDMTAFTSTYPWDRLRLQFILYHLNRMKDSLGDFEMILNVHDCPMRNIGLTKMPLFTMTRCRGGNSIPLPQWNRQRDGSWEKWGHDVRKKKDKIKRQEDKQLKAVFRGSFRPSVLQWTDEKLVFRNITLDNWRDFGRTRLLDLQMKYPDLYDIGLVTNNSEQWRFIHANTRGNQGTKISMEDQVASYEFVINVEGACGWADRMKDMMRLNAVVLKQDAVCQEFWEPLMKPYHHYIPIDNELKNLTEAIFAFKERPDELEFIRRNVGFFSQTYLTRDAWEYYMQRTFAQYAQLFKNVKVLRRPGSVRFIKQSACKHTDTFHCDDSDSYSSL